MYGREYVFKLKNVFGGCTSTALFDMVGDGDVEDTVAEGGFGNGVNVDARRKRAADHELPGGSQLRQVVHSRT